MQRSKMVCSHLLPFFMFLTACTSLQDNAQSERVMVSEAMTTRSTEQIILPHIPDSAESYVVKWVSDGDTIVVDMDGEDVRVRLIGIDTPESVNPDEELNCENGKIASDYMKSLLPDGSKVYLEYDVEQRDEYGRILAYVYLDDGETMLEELMLEAGMAETMDIPPNSKYADVFSALESGARDTDTGFWLDNKFNLIDLY